MSDERLRHDVPSPLWGEHAHRYAWAREHVREGWRVLDLACGTGFGAAALADAGARVVAADLDHGALVEGAREFGGVPAAASDGGRGLPAEGRALVFVRMDGTRLALADASLDLVVSFETLEHTTRYREMLAEFARVLRPEGVLLLSTPNRPVQSPDGVIHNPYHTQEFDRPELEALMRERFEHVEMLGQRFARWDQVRGARRVLGRTLEWLQYRRGVRKLPLALQDAAMRAVAGRPQYPREDEYRMVERPEEVDRCATLVVRARTPRR